MTSLNLCFRIRMTVKFGLYVGQIGSQGDFIDIPNIDHEREMRRLRV